MSFGKNLERLRKEFKVSQAEIGRVLGVTQQMISNYEKDCNEPNFAGLVKIAEYFGTSTDALLDHYPVSDEYVRSQRDRLLRYYDGLSSADRDKCFTVVQTVVSLNR